MSMPDPNDLTGRLTADPLFGAPVFTDPYLPRDTMLMVNPGALRDIINPGDDEAPAGAGGDERHVFVKEYRHRFAVDDVIQPQEGVSDDDRRPFIILDVQLWDNWFGRGRQVLKYKMLPVDESADARWYPASAVDNHWEPVPACDCYSCRPAIEAVTIEYETFADGEFRILVDGVDADTETVLRRTLEVIKVCLDARLGAR